jgi:hypothetical protein
MCGKGVAWRIFVCKGENVKEGWRECITRGFIICTSPNTVTVVKSRKMKWAGHVITTGQKRSFCVLVGKPAVVRTNTVSLGICGRNHCH